MGVAEKDLQEGIALCKIGEPTPEKMVRLAAYLTVKDHLFGDRQPARIYSTASQEPKPETIDTSGKSDFLQKARGKDSTKLMAIMDELMETVKAIQPRLYDSVMRRVNDL